MSAVNDIEYAYLALVEAITNENTYSEGSPYALLEEFARAIKEVVIACGNISRKEIELRNIQERSIKKRVELMVEAQAYMSKQPTVYKNAYLNELVLDVEKRKTLIVEIQAFITGVENKFYIPSIKTVYELLLEFLKKSIETPQTQDNALYAMGIFFHAKIYTDLVNAVFCSDEGKLPSLEDLGSDLHTEYLKNKPFINMLASAEILLDDYYSVISLPGSKQLNSDDVIKAAKSTLKYLGKEKYQVLLNIVLNREYQVGIADLEQVLTIANRIGPKADKVFWEQYVPCLKTPEFSTDPEQLNKFMPRIYHSALGETYPSVADADIHRRYMTISDDVREGFKVDEDVFGFAWDTYTKVLDRLPYYVGYNRKNLLDIFKEASNTYHASDDLSAAKTESFVLLWVVLIELFRRSYNILLHSTQIVNALLMYKSPENRMILQVKTGEGKSALLAILMAFDAMTNKRRQFCVTSTSYLAEEGAEHFRPFFEDLGLSVSCNCPNGKGQGQVCFMPEVYQRDIVYGTASSFQFAYLASLKPDGQTIRSEDVGVAAPSIPDDMPDKVVNVLSDFSRTVVIVDEVDNLFTDGQKNMTALNEAVHSTREVIDDYFYRTVYDYIQKHSEDYSFDGFLKFVGKIFGGTIAVPTISNMRYYLAALDSLLCEKDVHYVVEKGQVIIVDYAATGDLKRGSVWPYLTPLIEVREGVKVTPVATPIASVSQDQFFNLFDAIWAVTGTVGDDSCLPFYHKMYPGIRVYHTPRYKQSHALKIEDEILEDSSIFYGSLIAKALAAIEAGRPLLILVNTIEEAEAIYEAFKASSIPDSNVSLITGKNNQDIRKILKEGGKPSKITISTALAGRGADIITTEEAEKNGGLLVLLGSPPESKRVEDQNIGRTGRHGKGGEYAYHFSKPVLKLAVDKHTQDITNSLKYLFEANNIAVELKYFGYEPAGRTPTKRYLEIIKMTKDLILEIFGKRDAEVDDFDSLDSVKAIEFWYKLRNIKEYASLSVYEVKVPYYGLVFAAQRFVSLLGNLKIYKKFHDKYYEFEEILNEAFNQGRLYAFKRYVVSTLAVTLKEAGYDLEEMVTRVSIPEIKDAVEEIKSQESLKFSEVVGKYQGKAFGEALRKAEISDDFKPIETMVLTMETQHQQTFSQKYPGVGQPGEGGGFGMERASSALAFITQFGIQAHAGAGAGAGAGASGESEMDIGDFLRASGIPYPT